MPLPSLVGWGALCMSKPCDPWKCWLLSGGSLVTMSWGQDLRVTWQSLSPPLYTVIWAFWQNFLNLRKAQKSLFPSPAQVIMSRKGFLLSLTTVSGPILVGGGSVITRPSPSSFYLLVEIRLPLYLFSSIHLVSTRPVLYKKTPP